MSDMELERKESLSRAEAAKRLATFAEALAAGERRIRELKQRLDAAGDRRTEAGSTPVFRG